MITSARQLKDKIRNLANANNADPQILMRIYMIERLLARISESKFKDNFILKGGALIASMVGIGERSTMDLDTTIRNRNVSIEDVQELMNELICVDIEDGVSFSIKSVTNIMDETEYPGIRVSMDAMFDGIVTPVKVDLSTGDIITPDAEIYAYHFMLGDGSIDLWAYPLETILAEKVETIISRATLNTRMRDYYDIYELTKVYGNKTDMELLKKAVFATSEKRGTASLFESVSARVEDIHSSGYLQKLWEEYRTKYPYARSLSWEDVMGAVSSLCKKL